MHARDERTNDAVDQEAFEKVMRDNLSPEGIVALIACLQPADGYRNGRNDKALAEVEWLRETLLEMVGVEEFNEMAEQIM